MGYRPLGVDLPGLVVAAAAAEGEAEPCVRPGEQSVVAAGVGDRRLGMVHNAGYVERLVRGEQVRPAALGPRRKRGDELVEQPVRVLRLAGEGVLLRGLVQPPPG